ncbi:membrane protein [Synergistales bacterium]|nr:membrane protein [Synergistales bacterium]
MEKNVLKPASRVTILACYAAIYFFWGSTYLGISISIRTAPIFFACAVRFLIAGAALVLIAFSRGARKPDSANLIIAAKSGFLAFFVSFGLLAWAQQILPSSTAALIVSLEPAWFVLFDWLFFGGNKPRPRIIAAQVIGFAGCAVLVFSEGSSPALYGASRAKYVISALAAAASGFLWVYGALLSSKSKSAHPDSAMASGLQMLSGGLIFALLSGALGDFSRIGNISAESWLALLYLIVFGSIISYSAYVFLLRNQPTSKVSTHSFVNPIVAVALGWAIAGESITIFTVIAASLIVISVAGIIYSKN